MSALSDSVPSPTPDPFASDDPVASRTSYLSSTTTGLISCIIPIIGIAYLLLLSWVYKYSSKNPRPLNKTSGLRLRKYAPGPIRVPLWVPYEADILLKGVYVFVVLTSLAELALSTWLILEYRFNHNYPSVQFRTGTRLLLFASAWTSLTGGALTMLFLHPSWSKTAFASVGAQGLWILATWMFWVIGLGIINPTVANFLGKGGCTLVAYCSQIHALYGIAITQTLTLTLGMSIMLWLTWDAVRYPMPSSEVMLESLS